MVTKDRKVRAKAVMDALDHSDRRLKPAVRANRLVEDHQVVAACPERTQSHQRVRRVQGRAHRDERPQHRAPSPQTRPSCAADLGLVHGPLHHNHLSHAPDATSPLGPAGPSAGYALGHGEAGTSEDPRHEHDDQRDHHPDE